MSRIVDLVAKHCAGGVEFKRLGEIGTFFGGLTGKSKADFTDGNARFVSYMNVYKNIAVDSQAKDCVRVAAGEKQRSLRRGDIIFTGSSETTADVATSSVVTADVTEPLYLNSFCIGYRLNDPALLDPEFSKHLFRSARLRDQLVRTASGVTRFNVSKARLAKVVVPIPPALVQQEIVKLLDLYRALERELGKELEQELAARQRQFAFYRDSLPALPGVVGGQRLPMGELGQFIRGRRFTKKDVVDKGIPSIHYGEIYTHYGVAADVAISHVRSELAAQLRFAQPGDVVIAAVGETVEDVAKAVAWVGNEPVAIHDDTFLFRSHMNPKFVSYAMQSADFHAQKNKHVARAKVKRLSGEGLAKIMIPVPPRSDQDRVVEILDKFGALVDDLSLRLPAELNARRKQYEWCRDRLLAFDEAAA